MHSSSPTLASKAEYDTDVCNDDEFPEALECWSLQDFLDVLGGQLQ